MARGTNRLRALIGALGHAVRRQRLTQRPERPAKILVLHELLLGDTLMLAPLLAAHPRLRVVLEHITTKAAVEFVHAAGPNVTATNPVHHLMYNRNGAARARTVGAGLFLPSPFLPARPPYTPPPPRVLTPSPPPPSP